MPSRELASPGRHKVWQCHIPLGIHISLAWIGKDQTIKLLNVISFESAAAQ